MKKRKKTALLICIVLLALQITACGGGNTKETDTQPEKQDQEVQQQETAADAAESAAEQTAQDAPAGVPEESGEAATEQTAAAQEAPAAAGGTSAPETAQEISAEGETAAADAAAGTAQEGTKADGGASDRVKAIVSGMSMDEKISQMIIPAIRTWDGANVTDLSAAPGLEEALTRHQYGGIILFGSNITGTEQTARLVAALQANNARVHDYTDYIPYFLPLDEEGGIVTRLSSGTRMTGNMAIGATGEAAAENAKISGEVISEELAALGFNIDFAPVVDVNNNAANPVIGTRSFSDDPALVAELGSAFADGLAKNNIIATFKHFPGHGDTAVDSHIGTPSVEKTYEEIRQTELVPFKAAIEKGADMIMTAHITYPGIDEEVVFGDGETKGYFPATMSEKMITGVLRGDLGFDGVVVTDALEMDAIRTAGLVPGEKDSTEYRINIAEKVINAGVDLLLLPLDLTDEAAAAFYDDYIAGLSALVEAGTIPAGRIDESVTRILKLKEKYGILGPEIQDSEEAEPRDSAEAETPDREEAEPQDSAEAETPDREEAEPQDSVDEEVNAFFDRAKETVGSEAHHETEKDIARQAVTMVKNDGDLLPLSADCSHIVFLGRLQDDSPTISYTISKLKEDGILNSETEVVIDYYYDYDADGDNMIHYTEEVKEAIAQADAVIALSTNYSLSALESSAPQYRGLHSAIEDTHAAGGKFVLISDNLPYDCARFQEADAILLAYMGSGLDIDPTARTDPFSDRSSYNANVIAAIETVFGANTPSGRLPVNIPVIIEKQDGTLEYGSEYLYERGFGLTP